MLGATISRVIFFSTLHYVCFCNYTEKLVELKIIPDIIPVPPSHTCRMAYKIEKSRKEIFSGELITYGDIKHQPKLKWPTSEGKFYTLYMTGISFVDRRKYQEEFEELANIEIRNPILTRQRECWTVINIPGNSIELGEEIFAYKPVQIDMFNVTEYLIFLIYEQIREYYSFDPRELYPRSPDAKSLVNKYRLGNPWAGNFFSVSS